MTAEVSSSANAHDGTLVNSTTIAADDGPFGSSGNGILLLRAGGGSVAMADHADQNLGTVVHSSILVWYRQDPGVTPGRCQVIYEEGAAGRGLNIYLNDDKLYVNGWNRSAPNGNNI